MTGHDEINEDLARSYMSATVKLYTKSKHPDMLTHLAKYPCLGAIIFGTPSDSFEWADNSVFLIYLSLCAQFSDLADSHIEEECSKEKDKDE